MLCEHRHRSLGARRQLGAEADVATVQRRAPDQPAQNVTATFVGWNNAVGDAEGDGANVVRDDSLGKSGWLLAALACEIDERLKQVGLKDVCLALKDVADAVEAHPGVDRRPSQGHQNPIGDAACDRFRGRRWAGEFAALVVLRKDKVPELGEPLAVVGDAIRPAASDLRPSVPPDLRVRAARPAAKSPPVVAQARHLLGRNRGFGGPDLVGLVVRGMDRHTEPLDGHSKTHGHQLPGKGDRNFLEVVPGRREVAEHLEKGRVPVSPADLLDVARAQTLLGACQSRRGRIAKAQIVGLKRLHSGRDEERARVAVRHQRRAGQDQMLPAREML